jgi:hypothetical protein
VIDSLRSSLDTCNAKWEQFEAEIDLVHGKVASLEGSVCRCARVPSPERVPSPSFSNADSLESYRTPPIASPPVENSVPLPVAVAEAVLDSDAENQAPIAYDTGSEANEAEAFLLEAQQAYHENINADNTRELVRARRRVPLAWLEPYARMALGGAASRRRADRARREYLLARRRWRDRDN